MYKMNLLLKIECGTLLSASIQHHIINYFEFMKNSETLSSEQLDHQ